MQNALTALAFVLGPAAAWHVDLNTESVVGRPEPFLRRLAAGWFKNLVCAPSSLPSLQATVRTTLSADPGTPQEPPPVRAATRSSRSSGLQHPVKPSKRSPSRNLHRQ